MGELLSNLVENSSFPLLTALLLGLLTAISPCPLATNITAIGYIGRDLANRRKVFLSGIIYTLGRAFSYVLLAIIIVGGADQLKISGLFQQYGEKIIGPVLVLIGLLMLDIIRFRINLFDRFGSSGEKIAGKGFIGVFLLGIIYALAFCPYSGVLYFGILIPLTINSEGGLLLPLAYAIATGIPVILFSWLLAYAVSGVGKIYKSLRLVERWFRRVIAVLFIGIGLYYIVVTLIK